MTPELIGIVAVGVALAGLMLVSNREARAETNKRFEAVHAAIKDVRVEMKDMRAEIREDMDKRFEAVHAEMKDMRGDIRDVRGEIEGVRGEMEAVRERMARIEGMLEGFLRRPPRWEREAEPEAAAALPGGAR